MESKDGRSGKNENGVKKKFGNIGKYSNIFFIVLFLLMIFYFYSNSNNTREITWDKFETLVKNNQVRKVLVINNEKAEVYLKKDSLTKNENKNLTPRIEEAQYYFNIGSPEVLENKLERIKKSYPWIGQIDIEYKTEKNWILNLLAWFFPIIMIYFLWSMISRAGKGGGASLFSFGQSTPTLFSRDGKSNITFKDVAGLDEAKQEITEIVDFLKNPEYYTRLGAKIPKGILLVGPPGTGKTLLAKAVAGEAQVAFLSLSGSEFVEMFVGVGASRVRDLFKKAKDKAPCIIFIDEIDAIGRSRGQAQQIGANDERENTLNQLLAEMDGFASNLGVIVLAATNRGEILDRALLRPGRFDRHIYLELPDLRERKEIFQVHMRPLILDESIDAGQLAGQTPGFSGADIANVCNEAALIAARRKKSKIGQEEFMDALDRIVGGLERKQKIVSPKERRIVAFHEAGHALATIYLKGIKDVVKVSIIPRGRSLGAAWYLPEELQLITMQQLINDICILLGGRAAEEVTFGEISSGALDDLEKVTKQAYSMIAFYGLSDEVGNISYYDSTGNQENPFQKPYSEETAKMIDEEVRDLVRKSYDKVRKLLQQHKEELHKVGELLLQKEVVYQEDLKKIMETQKV